MKSRIRVLHAIIAVLGVFGLLSVPPGHAGTKGAYMDSRGNGKAVNTIFYTNSTGTATSSTASSPYANGPCSAVNPNAVFGTCATKATLPAGAPTTVFSQSRGFPNYVWSIQAYTVNGTSADNPELEARLDVQPAKCAWLDVNSFLGELSPDGKTGKIVVNMSASEGAVVGLRGFEYFGVTPPESLEDLKDPAKSTLRFDLLMAGPFRLVNTENECGAVNIPFFTVNGYEHLYFVVDTLAKSLPFTINCKGDVNFECGQVLMYPSDQTETSGGCGNVTVTYSPLASDLPPGETTVTATATDESGNEVQCQFKATRPELKIACLPPEVVFGCALPWNYPAPQITGACGETSSSYSIKPADLLPGENTVTLTVTDQIGQTATCSFKATTPAALSVASSKAQEVFSCGKTPVYPEIIPNNACGSVSLVFNPEVNALTTGETTVNVTATDGLGRTATCTFKVIVEEFRISCTDVVFGCGETVTYPVPQAGTGCEIVSLTYSPLAANLPAGGPTPVTVTAVNQYGKTATCTFMATRQPVTINGFYPPLHDAPSTCSPSLRASGNLGSTLQIKFDAKCNGVPYIGEVALLTIHKWDNCVPGALILSGPFKSVGTEFHYQWDTSKGGCVKGIYKLTATIGGAKKEAFIRLK